MAILVYNPRNFSSTPISQKVPRFCSWTEKPSGPLVAGTSAFKDTTKQPTQPFFSVCLRSAHLPGFVLDLLILFWGPVWAHMVFFFWARMGPKKGVIHGFLWWWTVSKVSPPTSQNIKWRIPTTKTYWTRMMFRQVCPMFESNPQQVHVMLVSTLQLMNTDMEKPPFGDHFPRETMGVLYLCEFTQG